MQWFIKLVNIVYYFYIILLLGILCLCDYAIFAILTRWYNWYLIILLLGLISGIGVLVVLNSIVSRITWIRSQATTSTFLYSSFVETLVIIICGTLIGIPGIITSLVGIIGYCKPVRILLSRLLHKQYPHAVNRLYSYFLAEYMRSSQDNTFHDKS